MDRRDIRPNVYSHLACAGVRSEERCARVGTVRSLSVHIHDSAHTPQN